jgi:multisubunit Na+/H+ antiporter MnhB subunit
MGELMTSPKRITQLALIVTVVCLLAIGPMLLIRPNWGILSWWPLIGLGLAVLLLVAAYLRGAYLTAQKRANMVNMLNDCYRGVTREEEA